MIKTDEVLQALREKYRGMTQQEIADKSGVARTYVRQILLGQRPADGLTLKMINRLLPEATLNFGGRAIGDRTNANGRSRVQSDDTINADCNSGIVILFNYGTVNLVRDAEKKDR